MGSPLLAASGARVQVLDADRLTDLYRQLRTIRSFEDRIHDEFAAGAVPGVVHLYAGQETAAVGVCAHLDQERDVIVSNHRAHGHALAKGVDLAALTAEIFGKRDGVCGGKGGSMHVADFAKGMLGANGIVGAGGPLICGAALASKVTGDGGVAVCFFGDGAANQGSILESLNLASVWGLPIVFVAENNGFGEGAAAGWAVAGGSVHGRAAAFGMPGAVVDGTDVLAVFDAAGEAIDRARAGLGPSLLEVEFTRFYGHFEGDPQAYRDKDELRASRENRDGVKRYREWLLASAVAPEMRLTEIDVDVATCIDEAFAAAHAADGPDPAALRADVYSRY